MSLDQVAWVIEIHDQIIRSRVKEAEFKGDVQTVEALAMFHIEFKRKLKNAMQNDKPHQTLKDDQQGGSVFGGQQHTSEGQGTASC